MDGIAEMFAELSGADEYEAQVTIEWWVRQRLETKREWHADPWNRKRKVANTNLWRRANPERARELWREQSRRGWQRAKVDPAFGEKFKARKRASKQRYYDKHRDHVREAARARQAAWRAANRERFIATQRERRARKKAAA